MDPVKCGIDSIPLYMAWLMRQSQSIPFGFKPCIELLIRFFIRVLP